VVINRLATGNTFQQWVVTTQRVSTYLNQVTDGTIADVYSNTNISVGEDLHVNGNVLVTGTFVLDEIDYDDLRVEGNLSVNNTITAANAEFGNLVVTGNIQTVNVTTDVAYPGNLTLPNRLNATGFVTSNLNVQGTFNIGNTNVIARNIEVTDLSLSSELNVTNNTVLNIVTTNYLNAQNVTITLLTGAAKNQIYETVNNTTAFITVQSNVAAFIGFAIALA